MKLFRGFVYFQWTITSALPFFVPFLSSHHRHISQTGNLSYPLVHFSAALLTPFDLGIVPTFTIIPATGGHRTTYSNTLVLAVR